MRNVIIVMSMIEKRYTYSKINDGEYSIEIKSRVSIFNPRLCVVNTENEAKLLVSLLNEQSRKIDDLIKKYNRIKSLYNDQFRYWGITDEVVILNE